MPKNEPVMALVNGIRLPSPSFQLEGNVGVQKLTQPTTISPTIITPPLQSLAIQPMPTITAPIGLPTSNRQLSFKV